MDKPFTNGKGRGYNTQNQRDRPGACAGSYLEIIADHVADGHALTAEKRTLLHNAAAFDAEHPNQKWVTDISYIQTQEGVLYLSMIRDLYDRSIVAYRTGTSQTINLVLDTIHLAMKSVKTESRRELHLHSDQGFQYTSQAYFDLTKEYGILPSMSRRGNCYDNALAENFFGILKTECIYRHKPETFEEANKMIDDYIYFYNHERIQLKTGLSPLSLRQSG